MRALRIVEFYVHKSTIRHKHFSLLDILLCSNVCHVCGVFGSSCPNLNFGKVVKVIGDLLLQWVNMLSCDDLRQ